MDTKALKEKLFLTRDNLGKRLAEDEIATAFDFCEGYKTFLDNAKTEREACSYVEALAIQQGYTAFDSKKKYNAGDKVYYMNRGKSIILARFGKKCVCEGVRIVAAHVDSPRLDLKPNPLYEDSEIALFKTHYYGGIKKYQWTAIPLALHGRIFKRDGSFVDINIGEDENDPMFVVTDLLPHLAAEQMKQPLSEGIKGESLNILIGSLPFKNCDESESVKLNILNILNEKYGIVEEDFVTAELEVVPAFKAKDIGFDRSLIGSYGHDDRVCSYPAVKAIFDCEVPEYTAITVLTDKEEIGSQGNTGLKGAYLQYFIEDLAAMVGVPARDVMKKSLCLSADVNAAHDPNYPEVLERRNAAEINKGVVITKYTGARGKSDTSDASAEYMSKVINMLRDSGVAWQTGELGKIDLGGGGTVAKYIANLDIDVVDVGVPVLSMHAPWEVVSKLDVYSAYRAFTVFFEK
ncbi:MAG: aminopeptidase [Clostridia bacterium]|nr:aminopeptidase [Clostridia bacterium]